MDRPKGRKVVDSIWVFKIKHNADGSIDRYKARLVAKGFTQIKGLDFDETFSPVVRYDTLRLLLALSAHHNWTPRQLDIKTAFLYGLLKEDIYMELPEGSRTPGKVAKLNRCIYGLKQSPREWYFRLVLFLQPYGFAISSFDPCVLVHSSGNFFISIYVDDITLFGPQNEFMDQTVSLLKTEFKVKDMGSLQWLLGIQIDYTKAGITLSQPSFITQILARFGMSDCNPVVLPIDPNQHLSRESAGNPIEPSTYQQIVGSLMYLLTATRPDLAFTITFLSQFNNCANSTHLNAVKRVLRYLKGTQDFKLLYPWGQPLCLTGFTDASYGNCLDSRRSYSGFVFQLGLSTISWKCRKQKSVATSTTEAEYMALAMTVKHHI